ncbi:MAG: LytTR family DNA-binding domain-containing protein [Longimicrobiales bacterium]
MRLRELEAGLDPERFVRIHRSHLINLDRVTEIRTRDPHRLEVVFASGAVVPSSRAGSKTLRRATRFRTVRGFGRASRASTRRT